MRDYSSLIEQAAKECNTAFFSSSPECSGNVVRLVVRGDTEEDAIKEFMLVMKHGLGQYGDKLIGIMAVSPLEMSQDDKATEGKFEINCCIDILLRK